MAELGLYAPTFVGLTALMYVWLSVAIIRRRRAATKNVERSEPGEHYEPFTFTVGNVRSTYYAVEVRDHPERGDGIVSGAPRKR